ncbi:hypothetical protein Thimo_2661 [Thioflavicoccus mobilis 8321]|uniref:Uncharacterized protein n=1 Tax=Thioflavicoccus mobilis 8321 TaxID=765912 RepID=L0GZI5_9GAMM|nr:tetratricopeptide repeat protein [Thioflavicoccus mobilis]AGA91381.1 hypothetical protein Thimo_2661 [Thioflavicoccus mobilis 8321]
MNKLLRFFVALLGIVVIWRILATGIASHYAARVAEGDDQALERALAWAPNQPLAVLADAIDLVRTDPVSARERLQEAYSYDPTNPRPLVILARFALGDGQIEQADALMESAFKLAPAEPNNLEQIGVYWATRGELKKAVSYWSLTLEADPARSKQIFPILMDVVEDPRRRAVIRPLALSPPSWWDRFFAEVAQRALDVETVRALYGLRREAVAAPVSTVERTAYVSRLQREGIVTEAYLVWVNGLTPEERRYLGLLYDGGFELEPSQWGFGWVVLRASGVDVENATTYGVQGARALHVRFVDRKQRFRHLFQRLFLDPGNYRLTGRVRPEALDTLGGLRWQVNCLLPETAKLGESERFLGASDWRSFAFDFVVPEGCVYQEVRLVSTGRRSFEHRMNGAVWFDALGIRKIREVSAAARASKARSDPSAGDLVHENHVGMPAIDSAPTDGSEEGDE